MTKNKNGNRRYFAPIEKVQILKLHLLGKLPVSEVCQKFDLQPTVFYRWQTQVLKREGFYAGAIKRKSPAEEVGPDGGQTGGEE